ncbi:hypothetical protein [Zestomonas carbonaria]|nr:hypothetical protein [Pseudomonas carbonaria]
MDALIGAAIMSLLCLGLTLAVATSVVNQRNTNLQALAVAQMRDLLQRNGTEGVNLCAEAPSISLPTSSDPIGVSVSGCDPIDIEVGGQKLANIAAPLTLTVSLGSEEMPIVVGGGS